MTPEVQEIIKNFSKFISPNVKTKISKIEEILELPIESYKFLGKNEIKVMKEILKTSTISEASNLDKKNPFDEVLNGKQISKNLKSNLENKLSLLKQQFPKLEFNIKKAITISSLISEIQEKPKKLGKNQKLIVVGLDNAGKTAIISNLGGELGIGDLASLKPTKGLVRKKIETLEKDYDLIIWDFGGQKKYREGYLKNPELYFMDVDLLIYVIDVQDSDKFEESLTYFKQILIDLLMLEENPYILIFLHKVDPEIKLDPKIQLSIELVKNDLSEVMTIDKFTFDHDIYITSIYNILTKEPPFSKLIKEVMKVNYSLSDPTIKKVEGLAKIMEQTITMVVKLSESLSKQLQVIEHRLQAIESGAISSLASGGIPLEFEQPRMTPEKKEENVRMKVLNELKDLFEKKKELNV